MARISLALGWFLATLGILLLGMGLLLTPSMALADTGGGPAAAPPNQVLCDRNACSYPQGTGTGCGFNPTTQKCSGDCNAKSNAGSCANCTCPEAPTKNKAGTFTCECYKPAPQGS